jgi:hypothetical protein
MGCLIGRARVAVLSRALGDRQPCSYSGRCLWGCPSRSLYTPSITIAECRQYPEFQYVPGMYVDHFRMDGGCRVRSVVAYSADGQELEFPTPWLVLAAGTLPSAKIFLESIYRDTGKAPELRGIMDNRQVLVPFVNLRMLGRRWNPDMYQYHQVAMAVQMPGTADYIHGLITTLKTALIHPLVQTVPFDLGTAVRPSQYPWRARHDQCQFPRLSAPGQRGHSRCRFRAAPPRHFVPQRAWRSRPIETDHRPAPQHSLEGGLFRAVRNHSRTAERGQRTLCRNAPHERNFRAAHLLQRVTQPRYRQYIFRERTQFNLAPHPEPHVYLDG